MSSLKNTLLRGGYGLKSDGTYRKEYACFMCNSKSDEKGIPLLVSQTTFSRICLGEKLQEILGEKFIVLITSKDAVCWACARYINWIDRCESRLDVAKGNVINMVVTKYKNVEMNLENVNDNEDGFQTPRSTILGPLALNTGSNPDTALNSLILNEPSGSSMGSYKEETKKKNYQCHICMKHFGSPAALGVHKARQHPTTHSCNYCGLVLSTEAKYKAHMAKHAAKMAPISHKMLNCVTCGFQTKNMEVYCRHACDSKIDSLVCSSCRKRYIHDKSANVPGKNLCPDCKMLEGREHVEESIRVVQSESSPLIVPAKPEPAFIKEDTTDLPSEMPGDDGLDLAMDVDNGSPHHSEDLHSGMIAVVSSENPPQEGDEHLEDPLSTIADDNQAETISTDLHNEMPEFFRPPQEKRLSDQSTPDDRLIGEIAVTENEGEITLPVDSNSLLKCTNCDEEFEINQLATHPCFISGDVMEYSEVDNEAIETYIPVNVYDESHAEILDDGSNSKRARRTNRRRVPKIPAQENIHFSHFAEPETRMHCKTCYAEFSTIGLMRQHWDLTGHSREVSTTTIELNKIKDKTSRTEQTFKVVKQNFSIRANVIGQNDEEIRRTDETYSNCIIKVKDTPSIEEFMLRRDGKICDQCGIIFGDAQMLAEHQCTSCLTCVTCHVTFMDDKLLKKHYQYTGHASKAFRKEPEEELMFEEHQVIDQYYCPKCHKIFPARLALSKHLKTHYKGTNMGACHYCLLEFDDKSQIKQHVQEAHGAYLFQCEHCDRHFLTKAARNKHQIKHVIHMCKVCRVKFKTQRLLLVHMDKVHRSKSCRICGKMITDLYALRRHERRHYYETGLKCDFCDRSFRSKALLKAHNKLHDDVVQFKCKTCDLGFSSPRNLEDHEIIHIKKQYQCRKCPVICPSRNFYWMHMKCHETAYKCGVCGRMFRDTSLLAAHKRKHIRARPYQCPRCPRVFSVPATLRRHLTVHTRRFPFKCGLCKKGFLTKYAYHKHLDTVHTVRNTLPRRVLHRIPSLPLNATDEDILQAADTLIADDAIMFNEYHKDITIEQVPSSDMITEEVVETTELFDEILH